jgi:transposase
LPTTAFSSRISGDRSRRLNTLRPAGRATKRDQDARSGRRSSLRDYDRPLYGERHLVESFFAKIKQFRAIATRYEKTARNFLAAVQLVASVVWLN